MCEGGATITDIFTALVCKEGNPFMILLVFSTTEEKKIDTRMFISLEKMCGTPTSSGANTTPERHAPHSRSDNG